MDKEFEIEVPERNFVMIDKLRFMNCELSNGAIGLLDKMTSLPETWDFSFNGLVSICKEGRDAIRSQLKELKEKGYIAVTETRDEKGHFKYHYKVYSKPHFIEKEPHTAFPDTVEPSPDNPTQYKNNNIKINNKDNKDKKDKNNSSYDYNLDELINQLEKLPEKEINNESIINNPFIIKLLKANYVKDNDFQLAFYNSFFNELQKKGYSVNNINYKINYVLKKLEERNYKDERGDDIQDRFKYMASSIANNLKKEERNKKLAESDLFDDNDVDELYEIVRKNRRNDKER